MSVSRLFEGVFVPGTVFTGDSDLCKILLASVPSMRTTRSGGRRAGFGVSQKLCICWAWVGRTFGSLRHCVEADLFAMTESRWMLSQMESRSRRYGAVRKFKRQVL